MKSENKPQIPEDMILIPAGEFEMGSNEGKDDEKPVHKVYLDAYYIDKYEVTNEQYAGFLNKWGKTTDENGEEMINLEGSYRTEKCRILKEGGRFVVESGYEKHPVIYVSWYGANQYAKYYGKRLPTEAEWEKACRGGSEGKFFFGDNESELDEYAWYYKNSGSIVHPVGEKKPNKFGIYDMYGNIWEWCADWHDKKYYASVLGPALRDEKSPNNNPKGPDSGQYKILRGSSWDGGASSCHSSFRSFDIPSSRWVKFGFRCAFSLRLQSLTE